MLAILIGVCTAGAQAQTGEAPLTFEVASVKPAAPMGNGRIMMGGRGGPGTPDPERFTMTNMPLKLLLAQAYAVKDFQISGPVWLDTERFDIVAKVPPGATKEQFQVMLQNLLAERFKLKVHREKKDLPTYTLTVGKGGPKLKDTELDASAFAPPSPNDGPGRGAAPLPPPPPMRPGEFPKLPAGRPAMMVMFSGDRLRLTGAGQTITNLVNFLSTQLGRPVVDKTGLTGKYDIQLEFAAEPGQGPMWAKGPLPSGGGPGPMAAGGDGGGPAGPSDSAPNLVTAVQQLGLKLDAGKGPVDLIVVDKGEKVPIEN